MPPSSDRPFSPGFRLSAFDMAVLAFGGVVSYVIGRTDGWIGVAVAFVVMHFFLFCNVVRMGRPSELVWAAVFASFAVPAGVWGAMPWPSVFAASLGITTVLVWKEIRRPSYHGVGWRRVNPGLPAWWAAHGGAA